MLMASVRVAMITFDFYPFDLRVRQLAEAAADAGDAIDVICQRKSALRSIIACASIGCQWDVGLAARC